MVVVVAGLSTTHRISPIGMGLLRAAASADRRGDVSRAHGLKMTDRLSPRLSPRSPPQTSPPPNADDPSTKQQQTHRLGNRRAAKLQGSTDRRRRKRWGVKVRSRPQPRKPGTATPNAPGTHRSTDSNEPKRLVRGPRMRDVANGQVVTHSLLGEKRSWEHDVRHPVGAVVAIRTDWRGRATIRIEAKERGVPSQKCWGHRECVRSDSVVEIKGRTVTRFLN